MRPFSHSPTDSPWEIRGSYAIWEITPSDTQVGPEEQLKLEIDLDGRQPTISQLGYLGKTLPGRMLGVTVSVKNEESDWTLESVYQRGSDLIATYQNSDNPQCSMQLEWRVASALTLPDRFAESSNDDGAFLIIDLVISLHTESLESYPHITTKTQLACDQFLYLLAQNDSIQPAVLQNGIAAQASDQPGCAVYRLQDLPWSYLEMVYPADFGHWQGSQSTNDPPSKRDTCSAYDPQLVKEPLVKDLGAASEQTSCWKLDCELLEKGVIRRLQLRAILLPKDNDQTLALQSYAKFAVNKLPLD